MFLLLKPKQLNMGHALRSTPCISIGLSPSLHLCSRGRRASCVRLMFAGASSLSNAGKPPTAPSVQRGNHGSAAPQQHAKQLGSHKDLPRSASPLLPSSKAQQAKQGGGKGAAQRALTPPLRTSSPSLLEADSFLDAEMDAVARKPAAKPAKQTTVPARPSPLGAHAGSQAPRLCADIHAKTTSPDPHAQPPLARHRSACTGPQT